MNSEEIREASRKVIEKLMSMPREEIQAMIAEMESREKCSPDTCSGACQGMGSCKTCVDFRAEQGIVLPKLFD